MQRSETVTEKEASKPSLEDSATWGKARMMTQTVAFRVIEIVDDASAGRSPIWGPCPLTEEEEAILRGLTGSR